MILENFKLDGKVALVTGANDGIGQGIALGLAEAGADIIAVHRSDISRTKELVAALGRRFHSVQCDLSKKESVPAVMDAVSQSFGQADILVNCAGTVIRRDSLEYTEENWDDVMNINLKVLFFLSQAVARQMVKRKTGGKIINIASVLSFQGGILIPAYTASKSGIKA
jgi:2-deoxy-D-gluconate 3-dehydrogenase